MADGTQVLADGTCCLADGTQVLADGTCCMADGTQVLADIVIFKAKSMNFDPIS